MRRTSWALILCIVGPAFASPPNPFDGTWRPDPEKPSQPGKIEISQLVDGMYECQDCSPPYKIKADGHDQPVTGNAHYDTVSVTVVDEHTVLMSAKKNGNPLAEKKLTVSADGTRKTEVQTVTGMTPAPIEMTSHYLRSSPGVSGSHRISGGWQLTDMEVSNNAEDTIYKVTGNTLSMSDRMGRSFVAKFDGTEAPYHGDPRFTTVSLKLIDARTIEESDRIAGAVVKISTWSLSPDGKSMHVRFDDTHGHIQEQDGHRLP